MASLLARIAAPLLGLGSLLAVGGWAGDVAGCSPPPTGWYASLQSARVPSDGYLVVHYYCQDSCVQERPPFTIRDAALTEIPGEVSAIPDIGAMQAQNTVRWRAAGPLAPGHYQIDVPSDHGTITQDFEVVPTAAVDPTSLNVTRTFGIAENSVGQEVCCPSGPLDSCGRGYCYSRDVRRTASVVLDWSIEPDAAYWEQYLSRVTWEGVVEPASWQLGLATSGSFETERSEYCYTLELKSMIDGSIEIVEHACVAHPAGEKLGVSGRTPEVLKDNLGRCADPPAGLTEAWCEARSERCTTYDMPCANLGQLCPATPQNGGSAGAGGAQPVTPASGGDDGGCSMSTATMRRQSSRAWMLALFAIGLWSRRARHRAVS